jgi:asparagine synthase (glutamine-hydrolysing)
MELIEAIRRENLSFLSPAKLVRLQQAVDQTIEQNVPGVVLEVGVALGGSGILLANRCRDRQYHGFDVFGMIPPPTSDKDDEKSRKRYDVIASGKSKGIGGQVYYGYRPDLFSEVAAAFARHGCPVDDRRVFLHKGLIQDTWKGFHPEGGIACAHIDCDWYDPVVFCLSAIMPHLNPGSMVIVDDYHAYGGCRTAVDEFLAAHPDRFTTDMRDNVILQYR